jgi:hypothetical protein
VPQLVTDEELPSALTLGGLQLNISGILGPALARILLSKLEAPFVFALTLPASCWSSWRFPLCQGRAATRAGH